jgi:flavin-dependent dehydrogenase
MAWPHKEIPRLARALLPHYDVVLFGAGLAGGTLARQILLAGSGKTILLLDRRDELPPADQKVGEATVQASGFYYAKVLDLEEYLLQEHYMKYNLRFYWKTAGRDNRRYEDIGQSYIRSLSNIPTYQLDRNRFEGEVMRRNVLDPCFTLRAPIRDLKVDLAEGEGNHGVHFADGEGEHTVTSRWIVDASGRHKVLARKLKLEKKNPIRHGTSFFWVEGLLDIERLTDLPASERRRHAHRRQLGHVPAFLATNHFCGEGFWFWVIPLHNLTSLGLVYDANLVPREQVATKEAIVDWVCREFPLFEKDLRARKIVHHSGFRDYSYDCVQTLSEQRWALTGEAGRFTDPLYSPGGDLISIHNTMISDAILGPESALAQKVPAYHRLMRSWYEAYVPSFALTYECLGDQEAFSVKYTWELAVYFGFYVFPFANELFTDRAFLPTYLAWFARLGRLNANLQLLLRDYYRWKKEHCAPNAEPRFFDFTELGWLKRAEKGFYAMGVDAQEGKEELAAQLANLEEFGRFIAGYVAARVLDEEALLDNAAFIEALDPRHLAFDPAEFARVAEATRHETRVYAWSFDPHRTAALRPARRRATVAAPAR